MFQDTENDVLIGGGGADRFVLGDRFMISYYVSGRNDHALISDFKRNQGDKIEVYGSQSIYAKDCTLVQNQNITGGSSFDTQIFFRGDRIAIAKDNISVSVGQDFIFVG